MGSLDKLYKALADRTRREILEALANRGPMSYTEIMDTLKIKNTGKLNYHLKMLGNLVYKNDEGKYALTEQGTHAVELLRGFRSKDEAPTQPGSPNSGAARTIKLAAGLLVLAIGAWFLLFSLGGLVSAALTPSSESFGVSGTPIAQQSLVVIRIPAWPNYTGPISLGIEWSSPTPVTLYVLNGTQAALLFGSGTKCVPITAAPVKNAPCVMEGVTPTSYVGTATGGSGKLTVTTESPAYLAIYSSQNTTANVSATLKPLGPLPQHVDWLWVSYRLAFGLLGAFMAYVGWALIRRRI